MGALAGLPASHGPRRRSRCAVCSVAPFARRARGGRVCRRSRTDRHRPRVHRRSRRRARFRSGRVRPQALGPAGSRDSLATAIRRSLCSTGAGVPVTGSATGLSLTPPRCVLAPTGIARGLVKMIGILVGWRRCVSDSFTRLGSSAGRIRSCGRSRRGATPAGRCGRTGWIDSCCRRIPQRRSSRLTGERVYRLLAGAERGPHPAGGPHTAMRIELVSRRSGRGVQSRPGAVWGPPGPGCASDVSVRRTARRPCGDAAS